MFSEEMCGSRDRMDAATQKGGSDPSILAGPQTNAENFTATASLV